MAALFHGQVINISGLARDAATSRTTIEGYIGILEDTLLATRLPAFESRLRARERRHPKRAHNLNGALYDDVAYWSPAQAGATEVDFVLRRGREYLALEVKQQSRTGPELLTGLRAIAELPKRARRIAVYRGRQTLRTEDGIDVWPFERLVEAVAGGTLWP